MLQLTRETSIPSLEKCCQILTEHNNKMGIPLDYDRMVEYYAYWNIQANERRKRIERYIGHQSTEPLKDSTFLVWLDSVNVRTGLLSTDGGKVSLSGDSLKAAIATNLYSKEINMVMKLYSEYKDMAHLVSPFKKIILNCSISKIPTYDGHRMVFCRPDWIPQNTGRIGMQNPGLMNIAKELADIETVPPGWIYFTVDSGQIEPRIIQSVYLNDPQIKKCTMMYNDAYYGYVHYCTLLTNEQRQSRTLDIYPVELSETIKEKRKRFKTYGNAVMYGSTENKENDPDKEAFIKYIGGHPNRIKWQSKVEEQINRGVRVFKTVFGTEINITKGPSEFNYSDKFSNAYHAHLVRCAINNPIQGTAADLMRYSIGRANLLLLKKAPNSVILKYTHDSGTFAIHENDYNAVISELKEITSYQVEDWIPIYGDPQEGVKLNTKLPRLLK